MKVTRRPSSPHGKGYGKSESDTDKKSHHRKHHGSEQRGTEHHGTEQHNAGTDQFGGTSPHQRDQASNTSVPGKLPEKSQKSKVKKEGHKSDQAGPASSQGERNNGSAHSASPVHVPSQQTTTTSANYSSQHLQAHQTSQSVSSQWVRIPYPLSSFYPPQLPAEPAHAKPDAADSDGTGNDKDFYKTFAQQTSLGNWMIYSSSQVREATVDSVNEAGDAIWKNTRPQPQDDVDINSKNS